MKLCSVNVSHPTDVNYNGEVIQTSIFKRAVAGPVVIKDGHLTNDSQANIINHGGEHKAVYAFSHQQYPYWQQYLEQPTLYFGQFGENLTIDGLDESKLCIGDRIQINNCVLEITQPRVPCFKLGIALNNKAAVKQFIKHAHVGIYFRIIQTGTIEAGQEVKRIHRDPTHLDIYTLFNAYFKQGNFDHEAILKQALTIDALSSEWRQHIEDKLA